MMNYKMSIKSIPYFILAVLIHTNVAAQLTTRPQNITTISDTTKLQGIKTPQPAMQQNPIELPVPITNAFTDFSFYFFKNLQNEQAADANIFVSPLSLHIALGMLANGAEATTKVEIMKALRSENLSQNELNDAYKKLLMEIPLADSLVTLKIANAIFHKNNFNIKPSFLNIVKGSFNAQVTGLPFSPKDLATINKWASENTNGKIPKVLDKIDPNSIMFLMNAIYFKADWYSKFDKYHTRDQDFYLEKGGRKTVKMMNQTGYFDLASDEIFTALQMPYGNGQFNVTLLLPQNGQTISGILDKMDTSQWKALQKKFYKKSVQVGLPKFKLEQEFNLNKLLQKMGMVKAFQNNAELQGLFDDPLALKVDFVKQNTFVAVDEEGTEAAAVTTIGIVLTSAHRPEPVPFICNKPFGFIISEKTSNTILFMGRIMNPEE